MTNQETDTNKKGKSAKQCNQNIIPISESVGSIELLYLRARERGVDTTLRIGPITATCLLTPTKQIKDLHHITQLFKIHGQLVGNRIVIDQHEIQIMLGSINPIPKHNSGRFFNQITFTCTFPNNTRTVSIKLFSNGRLHMTGLRKESEMYDISRQFVNVLSDLLVQPMQTEEHQIRMMNCNFKIHRLIQLRRMCTAINNCPNWTATYNPDIYPAVNAKLTTLSTSVFVFGTGSIVIAAAKTPTQLIETFTQFIDHILVAYSSTEPYKHD